LPGEWKSYVHVRVRLDAPPNAVNFIGVAERLEAALRNLLDNAASFARSEVRVSLTVGDQRIEIRVSDDGPGIAEADLPRLFDRFFTTRKDRQGTGLGLSLTRAVIEAHGGRVTALPPAGTGATFLVTLP